MGVFLDKGNIWLARSSKTDRSLDVGGLYPRHGRPDWNKRPRKKERFPVTCFWAGAPLLSCSRTACNVAPLVLSPLDSDWNAPLAVLGLQLAGGGLLRCHNCRSLWVSCTHNSTPTFAPPCVCPRLFCLLKPLYLFLWRTLMRCAITGWQAPRWRAALNLPFNVTDPPQSYRFGLPVTSIPQMRLRAVKALAKAAA